MSGFKRKEFWSSKEIELERGAPYRLNSFMTSNRFESILAALTLTKENPPPYKDRFWIIREMLREWNGHMEKSLFHPGHHALMNLCPSGTIDGHAQDGYFVPVNLICSGMNVIPYAVLSQSSCMP